MSMNENEYGECKNSVLDDLIGMVECKMEDKMNHGIPF